MQLSDDVEISIAKQITLIQGHNYLCRDSPYKYFNI